MCINMVGPRIKYEPIMIVKSMDHINDKIVINWNLTILGKLERGFELASIIAA